ncbi:11706_t:CDS:2 [Acaulospora colombiana]|uniref:11706_t:CDS:1 n=1 Tax=Acaulospora colombiana TaxID=27376 RepID=A0ACA9LY10_9GLOM|nr:11706_t:CDS:2 [Acaulospora colombiana]
MRIAEQRKKDVTGPKPKREEKQDIEDLKKTKTMQKSPGETFFDFSRYREKIKQKKLKKKNRLYEELEAKDFEKFQDSVKFGEVAQAPPQITAIPVNRGRNSQLSIYNDLQLMKEKNNLARQQMNPARKRLLEVEREKFVTHYRNMKRKNMSNES